MIADLERERDELKAALAEVEEMAQAATAKETAIAALAARFEVVCRDEGSNDLSHISVDRDPVPPPATIRTGDVAVASVSRRRDRRSR